MAKLHIDKEKCKGCMLCIGVCPVKILKISDEINSRGKRHVIISRPDKCTGCALCAIICPDCAIEIT
ncbi:MAG: 4Fe-4S binding protein [Candidatus Omnitrophota bacterium]